MTNGKRKPLKWAATMFLLGLLWLAAMSTPSIRSEPGGPPELDADRLHSLQASPLLRKKLPVAQRATGGTATAASNRFEPPSQPSPSSGANRDITSTVVANNEQTILEIEGLNDIVEKGDRDAWSRTAEREMTTALANLLDSREGMGFLEDVACSAQACRARIAAATVVDPSSLVASVSSVLNSPGERYYELETHTTPRLSIFTAREGISLASTSAAE